MTDRDDAIKTLGTLIKDVQVAMLTTLDDDGTLRSRPMATQETPFDGTLWFFTKADSPKVDEIDREHQVGLSYSDPRKQNYVSISGTASLVRDKAKIEELWKPTLKAWFPEGLNDPEIALLRVDVSKAEYWDTPSSTVVHLIGLAKALATGKAYEPGEHEKVSLK